MCFGLSLCDVVGNGAVFFAGGMGLEVIFMCSKGRVLCWKGKFFRPLNMSYFCKMLFVKGLLILPMFEG